MNIINGITLIIWQTASCLNSVLVPWTWPTDTQWISIQLMISCPHSLVREIVLKNFITVRLGLPANLDVFPAFCETKAGSLFVFTGSLFLEIWDIYIYNVVVFWKKGTWNFGFNREFGCVCRTRRARGVIDNENETLQVVISLGSWTSVFERYVSFYFLKALPLPLLFIRLLSSRLTCEFET